MDETSLIFYEDSEIQYKKKMNEPKKNFPVCAASFP